MKGPIRNWFFHGLGLFLVAQFVPGLSFSRDFQVLLVASVVFGFLSVFIQPVLSVLTLPLSFLTMGIFSWTLNVIMVYLTTKIVPDFKVLGFYFSGWAYEGFVVPPLTFNPLGTAILVSFIVSLFIFLVDWIID